MKPSRGVPKFSAGPSILYTEVSKDLIFPKVTLKESPEWDEVRDLLCTSVEEACSRQRDRMCKGPEALGPRQVQCTPRRAEMHTGGIRGRLKIKGTFAEWEGLDCFQSCG